jgi:hypothetical protein
MHRYSHPMIAPDAKVLSAQHTDLSVDIGLHWVAQYGRAGAQQQAAGK